MLKLLIGKKGTGKTKVIIDNVNDAAKSAEGNVVFISNNANNMYDITSKVRMTNTSEFDISSWNEFLGFICGIISGNFDITNVFVDGTLKIVDNALEGFEDFLTKLEGLGKKFDINFELSVSIDADSAPDYIKKYTK